MILGKSVAKRPTITKTTHPLPFERLSPADFERLCLWLVRREGYENALHFGAKGSDHGRDVIAYRNGKRVAFQCKLVGRFVPAEAEKELAKILELPSELRPQDVIFLVTTAVTAETRDRAGAAWGDRGACDFWAGTELDERVKRCPDILNEFFALHAVPGGAEEPEVPPDELGGLIRVPKLPPHYYPREEYLRPLKESILESSVAVGVTGTGAVGVQGMGGIGKTVLAVAIARDQDIRRSFVDGIVWTTVGRRPNLSALLAELASAAGSRGLVFSSAGEGKQLVQDLYGDRQALVILDDVWTLEDVSNLDVVGESSRLLITTRNREIVVGLGVTEHQVDVLAEDESMDLLASWADLQVEALPAIAKDIAEACGHLPLALAMIGAMIRLRPTAWADILERLERAELDKFKRAFPNYPYPTLLCALEVSVDALPSSERDRYLELVVFDDVKAIPEAALSTLWSAADLTALDSRELAGSFISRSLAHRDESGHLRLHDLQADYIRYSVPDPQRVHESLIRTYEELCPNGWASGPDDGYFFFRLQHHLERAGRAEEASELERSYSWLEAKRAAALRQFALSARIGAEPSSEALDGLWTEVRLTLTKELRRQGLIQRSPSLLGVLGHTSWTALETQNRYGIPVEEGDGLDELVADFYAGFLAPRLSVLSGYLNQDRSISKLIDRYVQNFLHERHRHNDPVRYRLFSWLRNALEKAVESQRLFVSRQEGEHRGDMVFSFDSPRARRLANEEDLEASVRLWNDDLFQEWRFAHGRSMVRLTEELGSRILRLSESGVEAFKFSVLLGLLERDIKDRLAAALKGTEAGAASAGVSLARSTDEREAVMRLRDLVRCVDAEIQGLSATSGEKETLLRLWRVLKSDSFGNGFKVGSLPTKKALAKVLDIPHRDLHRKLNRLRVVIERCRAGGIESDL